MNDVKYYVEKYILLCSQMCKKSDDYLDKKNVKKHNEAMKSLNSLKEELYKDTQVTSAVYAILLNCKDDFVKQSAATDCLTLKIHINEALKIIKHIRRSGDKMASMEAKRTLLIYKGKFFADEPF